MKKQALPHETLVSRVNADQTGEAVAAQLKKQVKELKSREKALKFLLNHTHERIASVQANSGPYVPDGMSGSLLGADQAIKLALGEKNYLFDWLDRAEKAVREGHKSRPNGCGCGVCRQPAK